VIHQLKVFANIYFAKRKPQKIFKSSSHSFADNFRSWSKTLDKHEARHASTSTRNFTTILQFDQKVYLS